VDFALHNAWSVPMTDDAILMKQVLDTLSPEERQVCIWKLAGFPTRDIADHLGISENAVDLIFAEAKRRVRKSLRQRDDPSDQDSTV